MRQTLLRACWQLVLITTFAIAMMVAFALSAGGYPTLGVGLAIVALVWLLVETDA